MYTSNSSIFARNLEVHSNPQMELFAALGKYVKGVEGLPDPPQGQQDLGPFDFFGTVIAVALLEHTSHLWVYPSKHSPTIHEQDFGNHWSRHSFPLTLVIRVSMHACGCYICHPC